jgi:putative FmdB family regulatory protein
MPTYEYQCDACGDKFEKFQSITAGPIKKCPKCGKRKVRRLISTGAGLIFKGSGFYITDYRSESYKEKAKADTGGDKPDASKADAGKSDAPKSDAKADAAKTEASKPAAKSESKPAPATPPSKPPKKK